MTKHACPWCKNPYLVSDKVENVLVARMAYVEHLNRGCHVTLEQTMFNIAQSFFND